MPHSNAINSPYQGLRRASPKKREHPDRLKINFWKSGRSIKSIRRSFNIDKSLVMRQRGIGTSYRIELWCPTRRYATDLLAEIKEKANKKEGHISLGQSYSERCKKNTRHHRKNNPHQVEATRDDGSVVVMQWNARSLRNKADDLKRTITESNAKVICIQEAILSKNSKIKFRNYKQFIMARDRNTGGGLLTLVHESLTVEDCTCEQDRNLELMKLRIRVNKELTFTLANVYIPAQGIQEGLLDRLLPALPNGIIVGDLNSKHSSWNNGPENRNGQVLFDWIQNRNITLLNVNKEPTYQSPSSGSLSTLDLTMASPNMCKHIKNWRVGDDLGSDHFPVFCEINTSKQQILNPTEVHSRYNLRKADWSMFRALTGVPSRDDGGPNLRDIENCILEAAEKSIPKNKPFRERRHMNSWWDDNIKSLRKQRTIARRRWKRMRTTQHRISYNKCNAALRKAILTAKRKSWQDFVGSMNSNTPSSTVWKKFRSLNGETGRKIQQIRNSRGDWLESDLEKAEAFNEHYRTRAGHKVPWPKVLTPEEIRLSAGFELSFRAIDEANVPFTMTELRNSLSSLHRAAPGPDNIHNEMLQQCSATCLEGIHQLINNIWTTGNIPQEWKSAEIIPLAKPNKNPTEISSYRPIALTSCLGKLMERMVNARLVWKLEHNNSLSERQFGFRRQRSTNDALLYITDKIYEGFDAQMSTIATMIDFEAAFDKIPHRTILLQCMRLGIKGKLLQYLANFLDNRLIDTIVNGQKSRHAKVENGIVQGSVISPTLFNIALHDVVAKAPGSVYYSIFADDVTIFTSDVNPEEANHRMQQTLKQIEAWCDKWSLKISTDKTECTFFTRKNCNVEFEPNLSINGSRINFNTCPKLLGVQMDKKLRWKPHIERVVDQCAGRLNALKAIAGRKWGADTVTLRTFYVSYIRSKMLYASEVWGSAAITHISKLQRIQSAALRVILGCPKTTPIAAMEIEMSILPVDLCIKKQIFIKGLKNKTIPATNPLSHMSQNKVKQSFANSIADLAAIMLDESPEPIETSYSEPPWKTANITIRLELPSKAGKKECSEGLRCEFMEMVADQYLHSTKIYTDGSVDLKKGISGAGYYIDPDESYYVPCNVRSSMDAELIAINAALTRCLNLRTNSICIFTDSRSALESIKSPQPNDYLFRIKEVRTLLYQLSDMGRNIIMQWTPAHCGILGNEKADEIAKEAAEMRPNPQPQSSLARCKRIIDQHIADVWTERWRTATTGRFLYKIQPTPADFRKYKNVSREIATFIARARTGHIVTQHYLSRFNLSDSPACGACDCREEETLSHILFECTADNVRRDRLQEFLGGNCTLEEVLTNKSTWALAAAAYLGHRAIGIT